MPEITKFDAKWITTGIDGDAIAYAEHFGKKLADRGLTNTQIRNIFSEIKVIESIGFKEGRTRFLLLAPKIAYTVKRNARNNNRQGGGGESALDLFQKDFKEAYMAVKGTPEEQEARFARFVDFMEASLAYHRFYSQER
jgi:CRISPR type III-A-associated protein Csm2